MPTAIETTTAIQDKVFAGIEAGQRAALDSVRTWAEAVETVFEKLPDYATATPPSPSEVLENTFAFTDKVLTSQREFVGRLFDATRPATRAASRSALSGTQAAQSAQQGQPAKGASSRS